MFLNNEDMPFELDTAITGGTVVTAGAERRLDVGIRAGRIAALAEPGTLAPAREQVPAAGLIVLPGGIDTHTHIRWPIPGAPDSLDDFRTGTIAAAAGRPTHRDRLRPPASGPLALGRRQRPARRGHRAGRGRLLLPSHPDRGRPGHAGRHPPPHRRRDGFVQG